MINKNKISKEKFLALNTQEQLNLVNSILVTGKTDDISKNFNFSYSWLTERFKEKKIFYVGSIRKFIIEERVGSLTDIELKEIRAMLNDYKEFKSANSLNNIKLCAGACGKEIVTKSICIDKNINDKFNEFSKKNNYINVKDLYTSAIKEFIEKYS